MKLRLKLSMFVQEVSKVYRAESSMTLQTRRSSAIQAVPPDLWKSKVCSQERAICLSWARWIHTLTFCIFQFNIDIEVCFILGFYATYNGSLLPMVRDKLLVPNSLLGPCRWDDKFSWNADGTISFPETRLRNCHSALREIPKERKSHLHGGESLKSRNWNILSGMSKSSKELISFMLHFLPI